MSLDPGIHRRPVPLARAYRLLNHGPTVLVSTRHDGRDNVMAAAWNMPLDFDPPKVAVVIDRSTFTRRLIEASGRFALNVPPRALVDASFAAGSLGGATLDDKFAACALRSFDAQVLDLPLVEGCVAWLECEVIAEPHVQQAHDLFVARVVAAQADERVFSDGRWHFDASTDALRTLHHLGAGAFLASGEPVQARPVGPTPD
jgi:flavin reductase (DIM6/NTAB) family NADH-FMN oxidoreductase RutF